MDLRNQAEDNNPYRQKSRQFGSCLLCGNCIGHIARRRSNIIFGLMGDGFLDCKIDHCLSHCLRLFKVTKKEQFFVDIPY
jgi:hypothetical protein